jgi:DNA-binding NtrC family response regulator
MVDEPEATGSQPAGSSAAAIIIADPYGHSREGLGASLRRAGFQVETASSAAQAAARMRDGHFALAIIDMDLPSADGRAVGGWDLLRTFRALHVTSPVILIGTERWRQPAGEPVGRVEFVEKPIDPRAVRALVRSLCAGRRGPEDLSCPTSGMSGR